MVKTIKDPVSGTFTNLYGASEDEAEQAAQKRQSEIEQAEKEQDKRNSEFERAIEAAKKQAYEQGKRDLAAEQAEEPPVTIEDTQAAENAAFAAVHTPGDNVVPPQVNNRTEDSGYFPDEAGDTKAQDEKPGDAPSSDDFNAVAAIVGERAARILAAEGLTSLAALDASTNDQLLAIEQIGDGTIEKLRAPRT